MIFWTDVTQTIDATNVEGKCFILLKDKIPYDEPFLWTQKGNYRFYYQAAYNVDTNKVENKLPKEALEYEIPSPIKDFPTLENPLAMMDAFAGKVVL